MKTGKKRVWVLLVAIMTLMVAGCSGEPALTGAELEAAQTRYGAYAGATPVEEALATASVYQAPSATSSKDSARPALPLDRLNRICAMEARVMLLLGSKM